MQVMKGGDLALCMLAASVGRGREKDPEMWYIKIFENAREKKASDFIEAIHVKTCVP